MSVFLKIYPKIKNIFPKKDKPRIRLLKKLPKFTVGAEIGVWQGEFSNKIMEITHPKELHLIDPWAFQSQFSEWKYGGRDGTKQHDMDLMYQSVIDRFRLKENVRIHRGFSEDVLEEFEDNYFDWIYIDGNHRYEFVLKDLNLAFRKVKPHGLIAGDDYGEKVKDRFPVTEAVQDFVKEKKLKKSLKIIKSQFIIRI